jgi:hypothetical protein
VSTVSNAAVNLASRPRIKNPIAAAHSARPGPVHPTANPSQQRIKRRAVLGGLISEYERAA